MTNDIKYCIIQVYYLVIDNIKHRQIDRKDTQTQVDTPFETFVTRLALKQPQR